MPPSAIVSMPVPSLPMFTPEMLLQVEPAPVTVTVPCEPAPLPMLAMSDGDIDDLPAVRDRECARARTADIEPAAWSVDPAGAWAGHRHRAIRAGIQSDGAAAATRRAAFLNCKSCPCPGRRPRRCRVNRPAWSPRRSPSPCPARPVDCREPVANSLVNVPPSWIVSVPVPFATDGEIVGYRARARDHRRVRRHRVDVCVDRRLGIAAGPVVTHEPIRGDRSGPVGGLGVCRNRRCCGKRRLVARNLTLRKACVRSRTTYPRPMRFQASRPAIL